MEQPGQTPNLLPNEDDRVWYSGEFGETRRSLMGVSYMYHTIREFDSVARRSSDKNLQEGWDSLGGNFYHDLRRVIDANPEFANQAIDVLHRSVHPTDRMFASDILYMQRSHKSVQSYDDIEAEANRWAALVDGETSVDVLRWHHEILEMLIEDLDHNIENQFIIHLAPFRDCMRVLVSDIRSALPPEERPES